MRRPTLVPLILLTAAAREAKAHTSWLRPNAAYEEALSGFVRRILQDEAFLSDFAAFATALIAPGRINSLAQTLIKLTAPGIPDLYQGSELWDLSLVDPDNRRPIDFARRRALLADLASLGPEQVLERMDEGLPKLFVIKRTLQLRREQPESFSCGHEDYWKDFYT